MSYVAAVVSILKSMLCPRLTLMSVANPWMLGSPAPSTSHSLAGLPGRQFSATTGLAPSQPAVTASATGTWAEVKPVAVKVTSAW